MYWSALLPFCLICFLMSLKYNLIALKDAIQMNHIISRISNVSLRGGSKGHSVFHVNVLS